MKNFKPGCYFLFFSLFSLLSCTSTRPADEAQIQTSVEYKQVEAYILNLKNGRQIQLYPKEINDEYVVGWKHKIRKDKYLITIERELIESMERIEVDGENIFIRSLMGTTLAVTLAVLL